MPARESNARVSDVIERLKASSLQRGDIVFVQLMWTSEQADGTCSLEEASRQALSTLLEIVGPTGTLFVPAFTLSFERHEEFDKGKSPAVSGPESASFSFSELARSHDNAIRSDDPMYSVVGIGPAAETILTNLPNSSIGPNSIFDRLIRADAKICIIGGGLEQTAVFSYAEDATAAPWQFKKLFTGKVHHNAKSRRQGWIASVVDPALAQSATEVRKRVASRVGASLNVDPERGGAALMVSGLSALVTRIESELAIEIQDFGAISQQRSQTISVELPPSASMSETISALWRLPRDIVSDGYDAALQALATQVPMQIHEYPTGTECWSWLIPEKWTCHDARLETIDGRVLFSYRDNPLHAVSYSLPFNGIVSREDLFSHLHTHPRLDDATPFIFKYYERDWGLCCSKVLKDSLNDERYRVVIDSEFSVGSLKVGECVVRGASDETFVLCAHLCHPAMVNDDLSGVVVGMQVMQELLKRKGLRYTYRFLILPETIGSVAYLSHNMHLVPQMVGGLFLEMLGLNNPHALQLSFDGNTEMDRCLSRVLSESSPDAWIGAFRTVVGNDERQFNGPGVRVPVLSLSRVLRERTNGWPYYPEYHSSHDTPELAPEPRLAESRDLVLSMIDAVEKNEIPVNLFQGELFCSRYGLHIDAYSNPEGNRAFFDILFLIDGTRSVHEIARICGISLEAVRSVLNELSTRGLVAFAPLPRD